jgi:hypothetical protein
MPAYFLTNTISDVAGKYDMNSGDNVASTLLVSLGSGATVTVDFITAEYYPNNNGQTSTLGTLNLIHTVSNMNITVSPQKHRVDSTGTILASGTAGTTLTTAATNQWTSPFLDDPTWTTTNCSDRIMLRLTYTNGAMNTQTVTIGTDRNTCYALSSIDHNSGCSVLRKPSQIFFQK